MYTFTEHALKPSHRQARIAFSATAAFLLLLALLHVLKSDLSPTWHIISEYQIGDHGWVMSLAFILWALSCGTLAAALRPHITTQTGKVGLGLLAVTSLGLVLAALGTTDPITATGEELTTHGKVHGLGSALGIPGQLLALTLISRSLARNPVWAGARRLLFGTTWFAWLSIAIYGIAMASMYDGHFGPDVRIGWPNRLIVVAYCSWLLATAAWTARLAGPRRSSQAPMQQLVGNGGRR